MKIYLLLCSQITDIPYNYNTKVIIQRMSMIGVKILFYTTLHF